MSKITLAAHNNIAHEACCMHVPTHKSNHKKVASLIIAKFVSKVLKFTAVQLMTQIGPSMIAQNLTLNETDKFLYKRQVLMHDHNQDKHIVMITLSQQTNNGATTIKSVYKQ